MPVPSTISDLSTTAGSNSPAGTDPIGTDADNFIRAHAAFIAQLRDGSKNLELGTATAPALAFTSDSNTGIYSTAADQVAIAAGGAEVAKFTAATPALLLTNATDSRIGFTVGSTNYGIIQATANTFRMAAVGASTVLQFQLNGGVKWEIDASYRMLNSSNTQPSFRATNSSSETGSTATFDTYTETYDQGSNFNHTTGAFVAPVAGVYMLVLDWQCSLSSGGQVEVQIYNSTTATALAYGEFSLGSAAGIIKQGAVVALARLAASDSVIARTGTVTNGTGYANVFSGHLLG